MIDLISRILGLSAADTAEAFVLLGYAMGGALMGLVAITALFAAGFWVRDRRAAGKRRLGHLKAALETPSRSPLRTA